MRKVELLNPELCYPEMLNATHFYRVQMFIKLFRLRIAEILEYFKNNARLKFHQEFLCILLTVLLVD